MASKKRVAKFSQFMNEKFIKSVQKNLKAEFDEVDMNTPYVRDFIKKEANIRNISEQEVEDMLQEKLDMAILNYAGANERANSASKKNMIESIIFGMMSKTDEVPKTTIKHLKEMMKWIRVANPAFFKLKDPITGKRVKMSIFITPAPSFVKQPDWMKTIDTAAATPSGELIFNVNFCHELAQYAHMKGVKPEGGMYECNGGKVPDSFAYIEFLILHEIYHIVHADHFYQSGLGDYLLDNADKYANILTAAGYKQGNVKSLIRAVKAVIGKIQNYVGDYITNYELVKKGYAQLPIGLFAEEYNYDNFDSMKEIQIAVLDDMEESYENAPEQDMMQNLADSLDQMDDHLDANNEQNDDGSAPAPNGAPEFGDDGDEEGDEGDEEGDGDSGEGEEGEEGDSGDGSGSGGKNGVFKVGDIVTINKNGQKAKITVASEPDENGKQNIEVEEILSESRFSRIDETTLTSDDITIWEDSGDSDGEGEDSEDSDGGDGDGDPSDEEGDEDGDGEGEGGSGSSDLQRVTQEDIDKAKEQEAESKKKQEEKKQEEKQDDNQKVSKAGTDLEEPEETPQDKIDDAMKKSNEDVDDLDAEERNNLTPEEVAEKIAEMEEEAQNEEDQRIADLEESRRLRKAQREAESAKGGDSSDKKPPQPIDWKTLLKKMVPKPIEIEEESITRMHNRTKSALAASMDSKDNDGVAIKAGIIKDEKNEQRLLFILDNSGSMASTIAGVNKDILRVMDKSRKLGINEIYIIKFDSDWDVYKVNLAKKGNKHTFQQFVSAKALAKDITKAKIEPAVRPIAQLFNEQWGGGTTFPIEMSKIILKLIDGKNGTWNAVMFTDTDILGDGNISVLQSICLKAKKRAFSFNLILDSMDTYNAVKPAIGGYKYVSYISGMQEK